MIDYANLKLQLQDAIYRLRFYSNSLIHILSLSNLHNNVASIQKNRDDKSHRVIVALIEFEINTINQKLCRMSQHCKSTQTESACIATSKCSSHNISLLHDMKIMSHDKSVDFTGVLSCRATLLERLQHNLLSLRQVSNM